MTALLLLSLAAIDPDAFYAQYNGAAYHLVQTNLKVTALANAIQTETGRVDNIRFPLDPWPNCDMAGDIARARLFIDLATRDKTAASGLLDTARLIFDNGVTLLEAGSLLERQGGDGTACFVAAQAAFAEVEKKCITARFNCVDGQSHISMAKSVLDPYYPPLPWWDWIWPAY